MKQEKKKIGLLLHFIIFKSNKELNQPIIPILYDNNSKKIIQDIFIDNRGYLFLNNNNDLIVKYSDHSQHKIGEEIIILSVNFKKDCFTITNLFKPIASTQLDIDIIKNNKIWYSINNLENEEKKSEIINKNEDYYLGENDIIKFGSAIYIVRAIHFLKKEENKDNENEKINNIQILNKNSKKIKFDTCYETQDLQNLKNPKFCKHIKVDLYKDSDKNKIDEIKKWIQERVIKTKNKNKTVESYQFSLKVCDKCNIIYPLKYQLSKESEIIDFTEIKEPEDKNYMILESVEQKIDNIYKKYIHIINLTEENQEINIGRNKDNDLIDNNDYISKKHAKIIYNKKNGTLLLKNLSKFGTSILIKDNLNISKEKEIYLQEGRLYFTAKVIEQKEFENLDKNK